MSRFHALSILEKKNLTPDAISLSFQLPSELAETFRFEAGQYLTLQAQINGQEVRRAYSLCEAPANGLLKVGIKRVKDGLFSNFAFDQLKEGDQLQVMPPQGQFVWPAQPKGTSLMLIAAGSGITPILSIVQTALKDPQVEQLALLYGNRAAKDSMFREDLIQLQQSHADRFQLIEVFSREKEDNALFGRIGKPIVNYMLKSRLADWNFDHYYLCGPEGMIDEVSSTLKEAGAGKEQIHFELFTSSSEEPTTDLPAGKTQVTMLLDDEESSFVMDASTSVLDAALKEGIDAPYSCQGGICSTCIARVTEGKVSMRKNQILTEDELEEGLVLACQAHPETPVLALDFDDV